MDTMQKPTHYIKEEGSSWEPWPFGYINTLNIKEALEDLVVLNTTTSGNSFPIAALKFKDRSEWDIEGSWRPYVGPINQVSSEELGITDESVDYPKCTCDPDPREMACEACLNTVESFPKLGDSLLEAHNVINGERQDSYGNPEDSFALIAEYWDTYLRRRNLTVDVRGLSALDVAHMMMLFKLARCTGQQSKRDNYIDIQGYAAIAADRLVKE